LLSSLGAEGEFASALRERIEQARDLVECASTGSVDEVAVGASIDPADEIAMGAARSRLAYLLAVAADHGVDVPSPERPVSTRGSADEPAR